MKEFESKTANPAKKGKTTIMIEGQEIEMDGLDGDDLVDASNKDI